MAYKNEMSLLWKNHLRQGLEDDGWQWDWTTLGVIGDSQKKIQAKVVAKSEGVWAGEGLIQATTDLASELGMTLQIKSAVRDGELLSRGKKILEWRGDGRAILALERPFLNLASYVGGIASAARKLTAVVNSAWEKIPKPQRVAFHAPRVTATRKTLPAYRDLAIHGVQVGGGYSHRVSLSSGVLIKENHIATAGSIRAAIEGAKAVSPHGLKIEIEVRSLGEMKQAIQFGADAVLLDNFSPDGVKKAVAKIQKAGRPLTVEVSGGLTAENIGLYVISGVNVLSSGSITHSVRSLDLSLLVGS